MQGTTGDISIAGILRLLCSYNKTGDLVVEGGGMSGRVSINNGVIVDVVMDSGGENGDFRGNAVKMLTVLDGGAFYFDEKNVEKREPLGLYAEDIILESARVIAQTGADVSDYIPPVNEVLKIAKAYGPKGVNAHFLSEEWNLMTDFNGDGNIETAVEKSGIEKKKTEAVLYGLISAGFLRRTRFKLPEAGIIAREEMGNIGAAIVDSAFLKLGIDKNRMGMRQFITFLNELEKDFVEITGKERAGAIIERIWNATK
ncbi:MAG: DUF4388 domain-containing protein [Candidatus Goldiibacteriota bacterium]